MGPRSTKPWSSVYKLNDTQRHQDSSKALSKDQGVGDSLIVGWTSQSLAYEVTQLAETNQNTFHGHCALLCDGPHPVECASVWSEQIHSYLPLWAAWAFCPVWLLLSRFPARWASCHFPCGGFFFCSTSTVGVFAALGFCSVWPLPLRGWAKVVSAGLNMSHNTTGVGEFVISSVLSHCNKNSKWQTDKWYSPMEFPQRGQCYNSVLQLSFI